MSDAQINKLASVDHPVFDGPTDRSRTFMLMLEIQKFVSSEDVRSIVQKLEQEGWDVFVSEE